MKRVPILPGFTLLALLITGASHAASAQCFSAQNVAAGGNFFEIEGPLQSHDLATRTLQVFGGTIHVPTDVLVDVGAGKFIELGTLLDPQYEAVRPVVNGTAIAVGQLVDDASGCASWVANGVEFLFAEHVTVGPLTRVDAATETLYVNGTPIQMSTDPRLPSLLLDASGNPDISIADLQDFVGTLTAGEGYFENGILRGVVIETAGFRRNVGKDNVIIEVARWGEDDRELTVTGFITPTGATSVALYAPGERNADRTACTGTLLATLTLAPNEDGLDQAEFTYRNQGALSSNPGRVCVRSSGGDANHRTVDAR